MSAPSGNVIPIRPRPQEIRHGRRAGETDEEHALRERYYAAIDFARALVHELEKVRATAEGEPSEEDLYWVAQQRRMVAEKAIASAEAAYAEWTAPQRPKTAAPKRDERAPQRIGAVKAALERAHAWHTRYEQGESGIDVMVDMIKAGAVRSAPELARVPVADWQRAIDAWPKEKRARGGDPRTRPTPWYVIVYDMLKAHGLTAAGSAKTMLSTFESASKRRSRPSRAKN